MPLPDKLYARDDGEISSKLDFFDDGDEVGVYKLMSTRVVNKKITLSSNGSKPQPKVKETK